MRARALHIALIVFTAAWFGAVLPGHQRGVIATPGESSSPACHSCRDAPQPGAACAPGSRGSTNDDAPADPPTDPARHCAVCHLIATMAAPATIDLTPAALQYRHHLGQPAPIEPHTISVTALPPSRAPPRG